MPKLFAWLQYLLPKHLLSRVVGLVASTRVYWIKHLFITTFAKAYNINLDEARIKDFDAFPTFNDFFTRELEPDARPISGQICSPADGVVSACGEICDGQLIQAKGHTYYVDEFLAKAPQCAASFITIYLAPSDYHRVHFATSGELRSATYIPGDLFSVNQATTEHVPGLFARNERLVAELELEGTQWYEVMVGAMIVAGIQPSWCEAMHPVRQANTETFTDFHVDAGDEMGRFQLGSTVVLVLPEKVSWQVRAGDTVRMGQTLVA